MNTRLLLVDDEEYILESYAKVLQPDVEQSASASALAKRRGQQSSAIDFPEYFLSYARSGEEAVRIQLEEMRYNKKFAIAFVDMRMPGGMDGLETIKELRKNDPDILCAVVTAYTDRSIVQIGAAFDSADDWIYFNKPFNKGELQQAAYHLVTSYDRRLKNRKASKMIQQIIKSYATNRQMIHKIWENMPSEEQLKQIYEWGKTLE